MPKATSVPERRLITGDHDPDEAYPVPGYISGEFADAPDLAVIGRALVEKRFHFPEDVSIDFLWKAQGTKKADAMCVPLKGVAAHYGGYDYTIWVAADAVEVRPYSRYQVEALLHHELCHIEIEESDNGVKKSTRPHDLEVFRSELEHYGFWREDRAAVARTVQSLLPGFDGVFTVPEVPAPKRPAGSTLEVSITKADAEAGLPDEDALEVEA